MTASQRPAGESGQASVELVALVPLVVAIVLSVSQLLAAGVARELAGNAAEAGAAAMLQGGDASDAARAAVPGWSRGRLQVDVDGRRVSVRLRPAGALPGLDALLAVTASADAGPTP